MKNYNCILILDDNFHKKLSVDAETKDDAIRKILTTICDSDYILDHPNKLIIEIEVKENNDE